MRVIGLACFCLTLSLNCTGQSASTGPYDVLIRNGLIYDGAGGTPYKGDVGIRGDRVVGRWEADQPEGCDDHRRQGYGRCAGIYQRVVAYGGFSGERRPVDGRHEAGHHDRNFRRSLVGATQNHHAPAGDEPVHEADGRHLRLDHAARISDQIRAERHHPQHCVVRRSGRSADERAGRGRRETNRRATRSDEGAGAGRDGRGCPRPDDGLIYPPNTFADTDELIALCGEAARYGGRYIVHMRSEGDRLGDGIRELIRIGKEAKLPVELYHFKASGVRNWPKMDTAIALINRARQSGQDITANMYTYTAGATGLTACLPPSLFNGGFGAGRKRLQDSGERQKIAEEVRHPAQQWENMFALAGSMDNIVLVGFDRDSLKKYTGRTLGQVAAMRGRDPLETVMDLIVQDSTRVETIYYLMAEENVKKAIRQPWVSFGSDAPSMRIEDTQYGIMHPRAFGNFARLLGRYVRDEKLITLPEAIRRLTSLPATNHKLRQRGLLKPGYFADVVIFDPATIADKATFAQPFQYAVGVQHVLINGKQVLNNGEHTGVFPGRALWGPGKKEKSVVRE